jgi:beta-glucosidase
LPVALGYNYAILRERKIMAHATFHFPRGFLWGSATSSHQVEGNNTNNQWWEWEQQPGTILAEHKSGLACDWWNGRWREDLDRAANSFQNAHRLSLEWSRIQPALDRWDEEALDRYLEMMRGLQERNLTPLVTLHHFSLPLWLSENGGWENAETPKLFAEFTRKVVTALKDYVSYWVTINEPNVYAYNAYLSGDFPPGKKNFPLLLNVLGNLVRGHALAYQVIHAIQPNARVGVAHNYRAVEPASSWSPVERFVAGQIHALFNESFPRALVSGRLKTMFRIQRLPEAKATQDFIGLNYYTLNRVSINPFRKGIFQLGFNPQAEVSKTGFIANEPLGFYQAILWARQFNLPILITENGVDDPDDTLRPNYLVQHIHQMWRAVNFNIPVKGYFHWTLVDNFEWERGWTQRFGLWDLDPQTQARRKRPSADLYAEISQENGLSAEMVARYAPAVFNQLFPNA